MGATTALVSCLLFGVAGVTIVCASSRVQGPERMTPVRHNYYDCPSRRNIGIPKPPAPVCPPGTQLLPQHGSLPHGLPPPPCPPWVDFDGVCHVQDTRIPEGPCRVAYGDRLYRAWRNNARMLISLPEAPGPLPQCVPFGK